MRGSMWFTLFLAMAAILDSQPVVGQERPDPMRDSRFVEAACPVEVGPAGRDEIVCGTVAVPENWEDGSSRRIAISVAVIRAKDSSSSEGFVRLGGGPTPNLPGAPGALQSRLRDTRDVVLFDYRGTGSSEVICPDLGTAYLQTYTQPLTPGDLSASRRGIAEQCLVWAQQRGIDPGAYNARNMARDVIAIVTALGYETWTIDAVSFGTAVAQHVMRARPDGLRAVIMRGPLALDATGIEEEPFERALRLMAQYCARQAACASGFPDPLGDYETLYDQLERTPLRLALQPTEAFPAGEIFLTGTTLKRMVLEMLYSRSGLAAVPMLIRETARGNTGPATFLANRLAASASRLSGSNWAAQCDVSGAWANAPHRRQSGAYADYFRSELLARCTHLGVSPAPPDSREPVQSDIPTLIVVGEHDPVTPPAFGREVARSLDRAHVLEMPGLGHEYPGACTFPLILSFLEDPALQIDETCFKALGDVPFAGVGSASLRPRTMEVVDNP